MRILLAFLIIFPLTSFAFEFDPQKQMHKAEIEGYGYKTTNLMILREVLKDKKLHQAIKPFDVQVPDFVGIASPEVQKLLEAHGLNISQRWLQILQSLEPGERESSLANRTLPKTFLNASNELGNDIAKIFASMPPENFTNSELIALQRKGKSEAWRFMVRSTGKEDTNKLANAGGNLSVANVSPEIHSILVAMGQVIASYFQEKSLMQRIGGRIPDETIFDLPLTPALIQRMIGEMLNGETDHAKIPTGCVVYTQETAARLDMIHQLQCSFGHNEGIVQSLVPLDTFYINKKKEAHSVIKEKPKRIVPTFKEGKFALEEISNPPQLRSRPSLSKEAVHTIYEIAEATDVFYKTRQDIELVYEPSKNTVYIVQARPLVLPEIGGKGPSYIANVSSLNARSLLRADTINPVHSSVVNVNNASELILAETLELALKSYNIPGRNREQVKVVAVKKQVDATSHASAVFRGDSKVILQVNDYEKLKGMVPNNLWIDVQRGLISSIPNGETPSLKYGWINYPLPLHVSVDQGGRKCAVPSHFSFEKNECKSDRLQNEADEIMRWTESLRTQMHCDEKKDFCLKTKRVSEEYIDKFESLNFYAQKILKNIENNADEPMMSELLSRRFLEAILFQDPDKKIQSSYSFKSLSEDYNKDFQLVQKNKIPNELLKNADAFPVLMMGLKGALTSETKEHWIETVSRIFSRNASKDEFVKMVNELNNLGVFPIWLNTLFLREEESKLLVSFKESTPYLHTVNEIKSNLDNYDLSVWSHADNFEYNQKKFREDLLNYFLSDDFLKRNTDLEELVAVTLMGEFVDLFDLSIKELKSSAYEDSKQKVRDFHSRIKEYFEVLERWARAMPEGTLAYQEHWPLERYLSTAKSFLVIEKDSEAELLPSRSFSVAAAALGSATNFSRHYPITYEDMFTLIHQSLNGVTGALMSKSLSKNLALPSTFKTIFDSLMAKKYENVNPLLTGIVLNSDFLRFIINIPLRNHSARVVLSYDKVFGNSLKMEFMGERRDRWDMILNYASLWGDVHGVELEDVSIGEQELLFTLKSLSKAASGYIDDFVEITCSATNREVINSEKIKSLLAHKPNLSLSHYSLASQLKFIEFIGSSGSSGVSQRFEQSYFEDAKKAIQKGIQSKDSFLRVDALKALRSFYNEDIPEYFIKTVSDFCENDPDGNVRAQALRVFSRFNEDKSAFFRAALKAMHDLDPRVRKASLELGGSFISNYSAWRQEIADLAKIGVEDADWEVQQEAYQVYQNLATYNIDTENAANAAERGLSQTNVVIIVESLRLYNRIVSSFSSNESYHNKALDAAKKGMQSIHTAVRVQSLRIFWSLVQKSLAHEEAIKAVKMGVEEGEGEILQVSLLVLKALVQQNQAYDLAFESVKKELKNSGTRELYFTLDLLAELVKKGHGLDLAKRTLMEESLFDKNLNPGMESGFKILREAVEAQENKAN